MKNRIKERVVKEAMNIIKTDQTIREIGKQFNVSKSTVHKDFQERLKTIDIELYKKVKLISNVKTKIKYVYQSHINVV